MMDTDPDRAYYGLPHVLKANEELVIDSLMITDELFRSSDIASRKVYVRLVESVKENGGTVYVFSSLHGTSYLTASIFYRMFLHFLPEPTS